MPRYPKNHVDVEYYAPGRKRRVSGSTVATSLFLTIIHEENPTLSIAQIRALISDRDLYLRNPDAEKVLDDYIAAGYGDLVPNWR